MSGASSSTGVRPHGGGTRQPAAQSAAKRGQSGGGARTAPFSHPVPLYHHPGWQLLPDAASLVYALTISLTLSLKALAGNRQTPSQSAIRNRIYKEEYLDEKLVGYYDAATKSVWIFPSQGRPGSKGKGKEKDLAAEEADSPTGEDGPALDILWKRGFFGKGSLSRSEPTWLQREKNRVSGAHVLTAEDITRQRRADRQIVKLQKAKERADEREKQAVALLQKEETGSKSTAEEVGENNNGRSGNSGDPIKSNSEAVDSVTSALDTLKAKKVQGVSTKEQSRQMKESGIRVTNLEYMQLQREEAFFIQFCFDSLDIYNGPEGEKPLSALQLWTIFVNASLPPPNPFANVGHGPIKPDNPFIVSYVVYHHYRSLGWVARNGLKFCVDWVLYKGSDGTRNMKGGAGPVGGHAEFAVVVIPTYEDPADAPSAASLQYKRDWRWLNTVNRVCSGVKKTVILTYVTIPALSSLHRYEQSGELEELRDPGCLALYGIKEVSIKRFIPTRMRD